MGIRFTTDERGAKVWRDDKFGFPKYSIAVSKKDENGEWVKMYLDTKFPKGVEVENGTEVMILDGFFSFNIGKDGKKYICGVVTDWERMDGQPKVNQTQTKFNGIDIPVDVDEDEVPFA